jgi:hypothetical protein
VIRSNPPIMPFEDITMHNAETEVRLRAQRLRRSWTLDRRQCSGIWIPSLPRGPWLSWQVLTTVRPGVYSLCTPIRPSDGTDGWLPSLGPGWVIYKVPPKALPRPTGCQAMALIHHPTRLAFPCTLATPFLVGMRQRKNNRKNLALTVRQYQKIGNIGAET